MGLEKQVSYKTTNTYQTLNSYNNTTKNVWLVFHGLGFLSRYFLRHFEILDPTENYIICPQAPSKFYLGEDFKHVGACWLTKEDTILETSNVLSYVDEVVAQENIDPNVNLIVFIAYTSDTCKLIQLSNSDFIAAEEEAFEPKYDTEDAVFERTLLLEAFSEADAYGSTSLPSASSFANISLRSIADFEKSLRAPPNSTPIARRSVWPPIKTVLSPSRKNV